jgi:hypothetical protein
LRDLVRGPRSYGEAHSYRGAIIFLDFWLAMGRTGNEGYARAHKLSATDKAAIRDRLGRPRSWTANMWAGKWLACRVWEEAIPAEAPEDRTAWVWLHARGTQMDNRGGWQPVAAPAMISPG